MTDILDGKFILNGILNKDITRVKSGSSPSIGMEISINGEIYFGKMFFKSIPIGVIEGLIYEEKVYSQIVSKLSESSPNFVKYIKTVEIPINLPIQISSDAQKLYIELVTQLIDKVYKTDRFSGYYRRDFLESGLIVIITKFHKIPDLFNYLKQNKISEDDQQSIFCQIVLSLVLMSDYKLMHNDLHTSNILCEKLSYPTTLVYNINNDLVTISNCNYIIYIFDWDLVYSPSLGNNIKLETLKRYGITNNFDERFDLFTIMCMLLKIFTGYKFHRFILEISPNFKDIEDKIDKQGFQCRLLDLLKKDAFAFEDNLLDNVIKNPYLSPIEFNKN